MSAACESPQERIAQCQGLVRSLALKIHRKLPSQVDLDDLISYGQIGLAEAARDFDPARGSQFSTYAYYRIRGAIYDGVSKMSWHSRAHYNRVRYQQMANETLRVEGEGGQESAPATLEGDVRWFRDVTRALAVVHLTTHGETRSESGPEALEDKSAPEPSATAIAEETSRKLHELIEALPPEAGQLIKATYFEGLTLQEAGKRLGISKSWASRLHAKTLQRLARSLRLIGAS